MTVHVPLKVLPQLRDAGFDWLVPAFREELVTALIRSLPKDARRRLVPVPDVARRGARRAAAAQGPLRRRRSRAELGRLRGVRVDARATSTWRGCPPHLRMTFRVEDERRRGRGRGHRPGGAARARAAAAARGAGERRARPGDARADGVDDRRAAARRRAAGHRPGGARLPGARRRGRDASACGCSRRRARRRAAMAAGTRRLLLLGVPSPVRGVQAGPHERAAAGAGGRAARERRRRARRRHDRGARRADRRGRRPGLGRGGLRAAARPRRRAPAGQDRRGRGRRWRAILDAARDVERRLETLSAPAFEPARRDVARPARAARAPRLRRRAPAPRGWPTSSATCRAPRGGSSGCRTPPPSTATACAPSHELERGLPRAARRLAARPRAAAGAARGPVDARGAAGQPVRAGPRHARAGVGQADPPRARAGRAAA